MQIMALSELLECILALNWEDFVYLPKGECSEHTIVAILEDEIVAILEDEDEDEDEEDEYFQEAKSFILEYNLRFVSSAQTFQSVVLNARLQKANVSLSELVKAFNFYIDNDAYIDLDDRSG
jgi:hypothetical protein